MTKFRRVEKQQVECKHEFAFKKDEETGDITFAPNAICKKCGMKHNDRLISGYEPPVAQWEPDKWNR